MSNRRFRRWGLLALVVGLAGVMGCAETGGNVESPDPEGEAAQAAPAPEAQAAPPRAHGKRGKHGPGRGGPERLLVAALHELELTDAQRTTIDAALQKLHEGPPRGPKDGTAFAAIAEGVRAGKLDAAAILAKAGGPPAGAEGRRAEVASALRTLHATLTGEQRRALVDAIQAKMEEPGPWGEPPDGPPGHGPRGMRGPGGKAFGRGGQLGHLLADLNLSDAQQKAIAEALEAARPAPPDREAMRSKMEGVRAEMQARLQTFAADSFDADAFLTPPAGAEARGPKGPLEHLVKSLSVVVPLLEPAQREALAARLEEGPPGPPHE